LCRLRRLQQVHFISIPLSSIGVDHQAHLRVLAALVLSVVFGLAALMAVLHFPFLIAMFTFVYRANTPFSMILHFRPLTSYSSSLLAFNEYSSVH